ncbi:MAG: peptidylprolyl isomerase [Magnetovibrio sp.]|nr:peptidylprolyl isomerase [Magnetovibrio sp.]
MTFIVVNEQKIDLADALHWATVSDPHSFVEATVERAVLHQYADNQGLSVNADEVQNESDRLRVALDLADPKETERWLKGQGLSKKTFAQACAYSALRNKVRAHISDDAMERYYTQNENQFIDIDLYVIRMRNGRKLSKLAERIRDGEENFHLAAMDHSEDLETAPSGGYVGRMRRDEVPEDLEVGIFSVDPGDIIGPIGDQTGSLLLLVKRWQLLALDDIQEEVRDIVFGELIADLTKVAVVSLRITQQV